MELAIIDCIPHDLYMYMYDGASDYSCIPCELYIMELAIIDCMPREVYIMELAIIDFTTRIM
jgi:hypothetical protein